MSSLVLSVTFRNLRLSGCFLVQKGILPMWKKGVMIMDWKSSEDEAVPLTSSSFLGFWR